TNGFRNSRNRCVVKPDRKNILTVLSKRACLGTSTFMCGPSLFRVGMRNHDDAESSLVGINVGKVLVEVLTPHSGLLVFVVEHANSVLAQESCESFGMAAILISERQHDIVFCRLTGHANLFTSREMRTSFEDMLDYTERSRTQR